MTMEKTRKRIGVVSIARDWSNASNLSFDVVYNGIGLNTGNLMFTEAMYRLIDADLSSIGYSFDPDYVNNNFEAVIIPAANWLNNYTNWDWFLPRLYKLQIPVVVIGLGLQANSMDFSAVRINESCRQLLDFFVSQPFPISVRGDFTRNWLASIGVTGVVTTGCPSLYMNAFPHAVRNKNGGIVFQATRYEISEKFVESSGIDRNIFHFVKTHDCPIIYQSEYEEMELLTHTKSLAHLTNIKQQLLLKLYGCHTVETLDAFLAKNAKVFYDLKNWSTFVSMHRGVIGTRLHGAILALNSSRDAILIPHDSRTAEIADFAQIPTLHDMAFEEYHSIDELDTLFSKDAFERYKDTRSRNQQVFIRFLRDANLAPKHDQMF